VREHPPEDLSSQVARQIHLKLELREAEVAWQQSHKSELMRERYGQVAAGIMVAVASALIAKVYWQPKDPISWLITFLALLAVMASGVRIAIEMKLLRYWVK
jgi:uncharacterized membrane protein YjjP (DUF1212 family)